ncbi:hypothetical protein N7455_007304 [Penicillium solitum]|uniref:uncharacterized protein n=1 Tax=Penicillium solitum TaxID=60172 RepID=UPI0032C43EF5|nr:hypothetical protein N7455_007304 [Penicillium solitum]
MTSLQTKPPLRILGSSGSAQDRRRLLAAAVKNHKNDPFDVLVGDWMSEANMTFNATKNHKEIAEHGIKIAANAGSSDTKGLYDPLLALVKDKNVCLNIAWVEGDQVLPAVLKAEAEKAFDFRHLCTNQPFSEWKHEPISAQAYLGGLGIAEAFKQGADIVVCGRVSDASPVIGSALWWHGWDREDYDQLANSLVAGHLIECSSYVTGGNFTGFKDLEHRGWQNLGLPIAEIDHSGQVIITKTRGSNGLVSANTCKSQLLYEIQGPRYYNSDVTAYLEGVKFEDLGSDQVLLSGIHGGPPLPSRRSGSQPKKPKARMLEAQIREELGHRVKNLNLLEFTLNGVAAEDAQNQASATVGFRVVAQALEMEYLSSANFLEPILETTMELYPGGTFHMDLRTALPREVHEYFVTKFPQSLINHRIHLHDGRTIDIALPSTFESRIPAPAQLSAHVDVGSFGPTTRGPLGWIVHSRSGDKGSNANVGFYIRYDDEYEWLRALLTVKRIQQLLAKEYKGGRIERFELPNIGAVHFLLYDHLDRGVSCTTTLDFLGKNVGEYLRSKFVDIPIAFLERGKI